MVEYRPERPSPHPELFPLRRGAIQEVRTTVGIPCTETFTRILETEREMLDITHPLTASFMTGYFAEFSDRLPRLARDRAFDQGAVFMHLVFQDQVPNDKFPPLPKDTQQTLHDEFKRFDEFEARTNESPLNVVAYTHDSFRRIEQEHNNGELVKVLRDISEQYFESDKSTSEIRYDRKQGESFLVGAVAIYNVYRHLWEKETKSQTEQELAAIETLLRPNPIEIDAIVATEMSVFDAELHREFPEAA